MSTPGERHPEICPERDIYTVSRLNRETKNLLETNFPLLWVEGEISNLVRPSSGHLYFSLKDNTAQVRCALFRGQLRTLSAVPQDGMHVLVRARLTLYEGRGEFQLIIHYLEEAGEGALRRAFDALKARLAKEGLFDPARKRPLPRLPRRIGVITSPTGAAFRDILTTLKRRFPAIPVLLYPVPVQGQGAAEQIAAALRLASEHKDCDVLILARGGGSLEDLQAFNEEILARAISASRVPTVCGVGHEIDFTIADLAADCRAPTPTAAAEMLSPDQAEWRAQLVNTETRLGKLVRGKLTDCQQRLDWLATHLVRPKQRIADHRRRLQDLGKRLRLAQTARLHRLALATLDLSARLRHRSPLARLSNLSLRCDNNHNRLVRATDLRLTQSRQHLENIVQRLHDVSPLATLERGYAIIHTVPERVIVQNANQVAAGDRIDATLKRGGLLCTVDKIRDE